MTTSMLFILVAAIYIAPHTSAPIAKLGAVLMLGMAFLAVLAEGLK